MPKNVDAVKVKIRRFILAGNRPTRAAILSGISRDTYQRWMRDSKTFNTFIESAESELQATAIKQWRKVSIDTKNANSLKEFVQTRFSDEWSPKTINELTGPGGAQVTFKVDASGGYIPPNNVLGVPSTLTAMSAVTKVDKSEPN